MKIVDNSEATVTFDSLECGNVFKDDIGYFWIKTEEIENKCNAIDLKDGEAGSFEMNQFVIPLPNAKLVID